MPLVFKNNVCTIFYYLVMFSYFGFVSVNDVDICWNGGDKEASVPFTDGSS